MSDLTNQVTVETVNHVLAELQQAARDGQLIQNDYYATVAEGRAAVADGETFKVQGAGGVAAFLYRRISAAQSQLLAEFPSAGGVADVALSAGRESPGGWEFHNNDEGEVAMAFLDPAGAVVAAIDTNGAFVYEQAKEYEFHNDDEAVATALLDASGSLLSGWTEYGEAVVGRQILEFHGDDSPTTSAVLDAAGGVINSWPADPVVQEGGASVALAHVADGKVYVTNSDTQLAADLAGATVLASQGISEQTVELVITAPSIGPNTKVATSQGSGVLVHSSLNVLHVVIGLGQSLAVGATSSPSMIHTTPKHPELSLMPSQTGFYDVRLGLPTQGDQVALVPGAINGFAPLHSVAGAGTGNRGETIFEAASYRMIDKAIATGAAHRQLCFVSGFGGTPYADLKKGTTVYNNTLVALTDIVSVAAAKGWKVVVDAFVVKHGEGDTGNVNYFDNLLEWQSDLSADLRAITHQQADIPMFMSQPSSFLSGKEPVFAMLRAHDESPLHHLIGADYFVGPDYYTDILHMTGRGYARVGEVIAEKVMDVLWRRHAKPKILRMTAAARVGNQVTIDFDVPVPPLALDYANVEAAASAGFDFKSNGVVIPISAVSVASPTRIQLTLDSVPSGAASNVIEYALRSQSNPRTLAAIPRGNVRDSASTVGEFGPVWNWAVHQKINVN